MRIVDFTREHLRGALDLVRENLREERRLVPALPEAAPEPDLSEFAQNGLGVAALEGGEVLGFLCAYPPLDNAFGTAGLRGAWSPLHAHAARKEGREGLYRKLYQAAAEKWVAAGALSHTVTLCAHDRAAGEALFTLGFGLRCVDAIRFLDRGETAESPYTFAELSPGEAACVTPLYHGLIRHLEQSPCLMCCQRAYDQGPAERIQRREARIWAAWDRGNPIGYLECKEEGENFLCQAPDMLNICGAYLLEPYRGQGVFDLLLRHVMNGLHREGYRRLGVDYESLNPTAYGFWGKHFTPYTHGVARRVDGEKRP